MANLMVALIGPGQGPRVPMSNKASMLRISGMFDGMIQAFVDDELQLTVEANGNHTLPDGEYVSVNYTGKSRTLIAEVVRKT